MLKITKKQTEKRFGKKYLDLLGDNLWVQTYKKNDLSTDFFCKDLWLPELDYLWRLCEAYLPLESTSILLTKQKNAYFIVKCGEKITKKGQSPEEAMLRLFIYLEKNGGAPG